MIWRSVEEDSPWKKIHSRRSLKVIFFSQNRGKREMKRSFSGSNMGTRHSTLIGVEWTSDREVLDTLSTLVSKAKPERCKGTCKKTSNNPI
jgi:hypothetical protein